MTDELREWLDKVRDEPASWATASWPIDGLPDLDELLAEYQRRLREQTERHDGGAYWIGTGRAPRRSARAGRPPAGLSTGSLRVAGAPPSTSPTPAATAATGPT